MCQLPVTCQSWRHCARAHVGSPIGLLRRAHGLGATEILCTVLDVTDELFDITGCSINAHEHNRFCFPMFVGLTCSFSRKVHAQVSPVSIGILLLAVVQYMHALFSLPKRSVKNQVKNSVFNFP